MAVPVTRSQFKEFCLRKLGKPVIDINVSADQVDDRLDESLRWYWDYHYDAVEKVYYKHQITAETIANKYITLPEGIISVTRLFDLGYLTTGHGELFNIDYQIAMDTIFQINAMGLANYYITRMNYALISEVLVGRPLIRYQRHNDRLMIDVSSSRMTEGKWLVVEAYQKIDPADGEFDVANTTFTSNTDTLTTTLSFSDVVVGSEVSGTGIPSNTFVESVTSNTVIVLTNNTTAAVTDGTVSFELPSDVWSDIWLQQFTTAQIKYQWGSNLTKFSGLQLPGGITFNGEKILDDAENEIAKMKDTLINTFSLPVSDMVG